MIRTSILGASGYVGGELMRLIAAHPALEGRRPRSALHRAGQPVAALHPHLALAYPAMTFAAWDPALLGGSDLILAALPHGETQRLADDLLAPGVPLVDLGADFRLGSAAEYERWYGEPHARPDLLGSFAYGLPEFYRDEIAGSKRVAAPGCYPTAANLALRPLIEAGAIETRGNHRRCRIGRQRRRARRQCRDPFLRGRRQFPRLRPAQPPPHRRDGNGQRRRGAVHAAPRPRQPRHPRHLLRQGDAGRAIRWRSCARLMPASAFVHVGETPPESKWASGSNAAFLSARYDERTGMVVALAAIDNLGKGAAGQMIQCANLMLGLDEGAGLSTMGVYP